MAKRRAAKKTTKKRKTPKRRSRRHTGGGLYKRPAPARKRSRKLTRMHAKHPSVLFLFGGDPSITEAEGRRLDRGESIQSIFASRRR